MANAVVLSEYRNGHGLLHIETNLSFGIVSFMTNSKYSNNVKCTVRTITVSVGKLRFPLKYHYKAN